MYENYAILWVTTFIICIFITNQWRRLLALYTIIILLDDYSIDFLKGL